MDSLADGDKCRAGTEGKSFSFFKYVFPSRRVVSSFKTQKNDNILKYSMFLPNT